MRRAVSTALAALLLAASPVASGSASAQQACHPAEGFDVTICVSVTSNGSVQKGRVFSGDEDVFGIVRFGISQTDKECAKDRRGRRPIRRNCSTASGRVGADFITPFSDYVSPRAAFCGVELMGSDGCGGRALAEGLRYVVGFDSAQGAFAIHEYGTIGESHGCIRASASVARFVYERYSSGESVGLVVLDRR